MKEFRADLHCHSTCSDGSLTPEQLVKLAVEIGLSGLSISDHDSIAAYSTALPLAQGLGLEMISGAEFSAVHGDVSVHILGYSFDLNSTAIHHFCQKHHQRRENRNRAILEKLKEHKMPVTENELMQSASEQEPNLRRTIGRPHIAQVMIKKGYVHTVSEAFQKYLGETKSCYAPGESYSVEETIDVIHQANGLAFIAHPHLMENQGTLNSLLKMNFDGLEGYYAKFPSQQHQRWLKIAEKKGWLISGGSDFHGDIKPNIPLGCSWVDEKTFRQLQDHFKNNLQ